MNSLKKVLTTATLTAILLMGTSFANAGIIVAGSVDEPTNQPCTEQKAEDVKVDSGIIVAGATGIIVAGFTGIIVAGFTGIIVAGATDEEPTVNCGIIVAG